ncbi:MAG: hypothetical protein WCW14_00780 [Candidatus Paceibacterota bacterium]
MGSVFVNGSVASAYTSGAGTSYTTAGPTPNTAANSVDPTTQKYVVDGKTYTYSELMSAGRAIAGLGDVELTQEQQNILNAATMASAANAAYYAEISSQDAKKSICGLNPICWIGYAMTSIGQGLIKIVLSVVVILLDWVFLPIASLGLTLAGNLLDISIDYSIYKMSSLLGTGGPILTIWILIRDLANVALIFGLLYAAIAQILDLSGRDVKKMVGGIIIAALFINFSMFITKVIIDTGNIVATQVYQEIKTKGVPGNSKVTLSEAVMNALYLQNLYNFTNQAAGSDQGKLAAASTGQAVISTLRVILVCYATWAFLIAAMLFVARFVAFLFLLAFSPIGFIGELVPGLKEYSGKWLKTLIDQTLVAPVFLFGMYLVVKVVNSDAFKGTDVGVISMLSFVIVIVAIQQIVKATKKLSGEFGSAITGGIQTAIGAAAGLAIGGTALLGRATVGRAATAKLADKPYMDELKRKAQEGGASGYIARTKLLSLDARSKGSFDLRSNSLVSGQLKKTGVDFGSAGGKGGFDARVKEREKIYESKSPLEADKSAGDEALRKHRDDLASGRDQAHIDSLRSDLEYNKGVADPTSSFSEAERIAAKKKIDEIQAQIGEKEGELNKKKNLKEDQIRKKAESDSMIERLEKGLGKEGKKAKEIEARKEDIKRRKKLAMDSAQNEAERKQREEHYNKEIEAEEKKVAKLKLTKDEIARRKQIAEIKKRSGKSDGEKILEELQKKAEETAKQNTSTGGTQTPPTP